MNPEEFANIERCEREFWWFRGMEQILFQLLTPVAAKRGALRAVEAGCGTGHMASRFEEQYGWRVFPTDLQPQGLVYGQRHGVKRMAQADVCALPFPDAGFDVALCLDVIAHLPRGEEHKAVQELVRVLAPGGLLVMRTSALDILRSNHSAFTIERQRFTRARFMKLAADHGIKVLRCTYVNSLLMPVALTKFRVMEPLLRSRVSSGVQPVADWLNRLLLGVLRLEAKWLASGHGFPLGQSLVLIGERCV